MSLRCPWVGILRGLFERVPHSSLEAMSIGGERREGPLPCTSPVSQQSNIKGIIEVTNTTPSRFNFTISTYGVRYRNPSYTDVMGSET